MITIIACYLLAGAIMGEAWLRGEEFNLSAANDQYKAPPWLSYLACIVVWPYLLLRLFLRRNG